MLPPCMPLGRRLLARPSCNSHATHHWRVGRHLQRRTVVVNCMPSSGAQSFDPCTLIAYEVEEPLAKYLGPIGATAYPDDRVLNGYCGWGRPPREREGIVLTVKWRKRNFHFAVGAAVYNPTNPPSWVRDLRSKATFLEHPWALRITGHTAQVACQMWEVRKELKKTRGKVGWGTLYLLQRLSTDGVPEPHYKVGMTRKSAAERCRAIAGDTQRQWRILRTWRSRFAPVVERLVHLQLRRYRADPQSKRREWHDVDDVRIVLLAVEDMLAASQFIYVDEALARQNSYVAKVVEECGLQLPDPCPQPPVTAEDISAEAVWAAAAARTLEPQGGT